MPAGGEFINLKRRSLNTTTAGNNAITHEIRRCCTAMTKTSNDAIDGLTSHTAARRDANY